MNRNQNITTELAARETVFLFTRHPQGHSLALPVSIPPELRDPDKQDLLRKHADMASKNDGFSLLEAGPGRITAVQKLNRTDRFLYWSLELDGNKEENDLTHLRDCPDFIRSYLYFRFDSDDFSNQSGPNGTRLERQRQMLLANLENCLNELGTVLDADSGMEVQECVIKGEGILRELFKLQYIESLNKTGPSLDEYIAGAAGKDTVDSAAGTESALSPDADMLPDSSSGTGEPLRHEKKLVENTETSLDPEDEYPLQNAIDEHKRKIIDYHEPNSRIAPRHLGKTIWSPNFPKFSTIAITLLVVCVSVFSFWKFISRSDRDPVADAGTTGIDSNTGEILSMLNQAITRQTQSKPDNEKIILSAIPLEPNTREATENRGAIEQTRILAPAELDPDASRLLLSGNPARAAAKWWNSMKTLPGGLYTVQLELDCIERTILNTHEALSGTPELFVLPVPVGSRSCHRVCLGLFQDRLTAEARIIELPAKFKSIEYPPQIVQLHELIR